jgi:hypothetical protein
MRSNLESGEILSRKIGVGALAITACLAVQEPVTPFLRRLILLVENSPSI